MKKSVKNKINWKKILSLVLVILGVLLMINSARINFTGKAINETESDLATGINFILSLVFLIIGMGLLLVEKEGNLAKKVLESGAVVTNRKKIIKIIKKSGYIVGEEVNEGTRVYTPEYKILTVVPRHKDLSIGVSRNILYALATGESTFKRKHGQIYP